MLAFHFPPFGGSSGVLRTLKFARYLPDRGWEPVVLTADEKAYERLDRERNAELPRDLVVLRAFCLDTKRHLSFRGKHLHFLSIPDRWATWAIGAVPTGVSAVFRQNIDVIYSTFPIASAVFIGFLLKKITGKPWVVDFRDSMTEDHYPSDPLTHRVWRWIEGKAVEHGTRILFTAPSAREMYLKRYPALDPEKCKVIPNGYDEPDFREFRPLDSDEGIRNRPIRLLHSGLIYRNERDPRIFFRALSRLKREGSLTSGNVRIELRGAGSEDYYRAICRELDIEDLVFFLPLVTYRDALREMAEVDGFLLFQSSGCNHQIPAKVYEYLRLGKPILALTDSKGDTAGLLKETGGATIADLTDEEEIVRGFRSFREMVGTASHALPDPRKVREYSREEQAGRLAECFDSIDAGTHA